MNKPIEPKSTNAGAFVLETQELAEKEHFKNVSTIWYDKTISIAQALNGLGETRSERKSLTVSLGRIEPVVVDDRFGLAVESDVFYPDRHSAGQLGTCLGVTSQYARHLVASEQRGAAEALVYAINHAMTAVDQTKTFVLHVQNDELLRGFLPKWSFSMRNEWYLRVLDRVAPGARLSHYRGDPYTLYANLLIPDTIRGEEDSEYGAMVAFSNSEIAETRFGQRPALFRAICCNGCIWGQNEGKAFTFTRSAAHDLTELEKRITENIREQIPIAKHALDTLLATRGFHTDVSIKPVIAQLAIDFKLNRPQTSAVLGGWWAERQQTPDYQTSLFALINAVTRAAQGLDNKTWVKSDEIGGSLASMRRDDWDSFASRASNLKQNDVTCRFAPWSIST